MSVLAVVAKAVFEKDARGLGIGDVWATSLYASQNPGLASLADGGALFLVTVRPGDQLWLVAVLESPKASKQGWSAAPNTTPIRDITSLIAKLAFTTGKGITAAPGKLGMSLQTPRQLTAADEAALRGTTKTSPATTKTAPAWRLDAYRNRALSTDLTKPEAKLLEPFIGLLEQNDEDEGGLELADVVDSATGKVIALFALWPVEAGCVIDAATGEVMADIYECYFDAHGDEALRARFRDAMEAAAPKIRFRDKVLFSGGRDTPKPTPTSAGSPDDPGVLAAIRALRSELDSAKSAKRDVHEGMKKIAALLTIFGATQRPYPVRRAFELSDAERALLELIADHYDWALDLRHLGLPWKSAAVQENERGSKGSPLTRMVGRKPALALDTTIELDGKPHPLWAIASDVLHGLRPESVWWSGFETLAPAVRVDAWRQLASGIDQLDIVTPRDRKEVQRGWADPAYTDAVAEKYLQLVRGAFDRLGDRGEAAALAVLEAVGTDRSNRGNNRERVAALDGLARIARTRGGWLDPKYDAMFGPDDAPTVHAVALLRELPPERAGELTALDYFLMKAFPSESGMRRLIEKMASNDQWQAPTGSWGKLLNELAALFPAAALPLVERDKPKLTRHPDAFDKAIQIATKKLAKQAAPKPKRKK